ncbi:MAG: dihydroorotate dehydrogenase electron transfer subunit [Oscillospiraceae bacterium]|jgi:dihydroorotate dehydrogenase electron transfer subunit
MTQAYYEIISNNPIAPSVFRMSLSGDTSEITRPGQFVNIKIDGLFLRRPISVCDWDRNNLTIIYKVVGEGTKLMSRMKPGQKLDLLCGLGNGFDTSKCPEKAALVGGGAGVPPLYGLAKRLIAEGKKPFAVLGFNTGAEIFLKDEFCALGIRTVIATLDGSAGIEGFVTDALREESYDYYCACGPLPMLRAVYDMGARGQLSFEERMGCGFGACMGCTCKTLTGGKRICVEGPVLDSGEVLFDEA